MIVGYRAITPFLAGFRDGLQAALLSFIAGVSPLMAMFGRSLLSVQSQRVACCVILSLIDLVENVVSEPFLADSSVVAFDIGVLLRFAHCRTGDASIAENGVGSIPD